MTGLIPLCCETVPLLLLKRSNKHTKIHFPVKRCITISFDALMNILKARVSIRQLKPDPVPRWVINQLLDAAIRAPSNHNCQPWHFVVLESQRAKRELAENMGKAWYKDLLRSGTTVDVAERLVNNSVQRFSQAPVLILGCLDKTRLPTVPDFLEKEEQLMGIHSVAMSLFAIQLAAAQLGLASCWYCAPLYCPDVVTKTLQLPTTLAPQALLAVGYPVHSGRERSRRPWQECTTFL